MARYKNPFKWKQYQSDVILLCVRWYSSYSLSYRDLVEMMSERGFEMAPSTIMRWVHEIAPQLNRKLGKHLRISTRFWKVDEVMVKVKGDWMYLYRAIDSDGKTLDFMLSKYRTKAAAKRFFKRTLKKPKNKSPLQVTVDKHAAYPPAFEQLRKDMVFSRKAKLRQSKYKNNSLEQDHRFIQKVIKRCLGFFTVDGARATIAGVEAVHMLRKGQTRRSLPTGFERAKFVNQLFGVAG